MHPFWYQSANPGAVRCAARMMHQSLVGAQWRGSTFGQPVQCSLVLRLWAAVSACAGSECEDEVKLHISKAGRQHRRNYTLPEAMQRTAATLDRNASWQRRCFLQNSAQSEMKGIGKVWCKPPETALETA